MKKPKVVVADRAYDSRIIRKTLAGHQVKAQIPERPPPRKKLPEGKKRRRKGRKPTLNIETYKRRNIIERLFERMKEMRRFATRYEKLADNYLAFVLIACIKICIKPYFSDTP